MIMYPPQSLGVTPYLLTLKFFFKFIYLFDTIDNRSRILKNEKYYEKIDKLLITPLIFNPSSLF